MKMMFTSTADRADWWRAELTKRIPDLELRRYPEIGDPSEIDYALVWKPKPGLLARCDRLRAIFSLGAGVDHILCDPALPKSVPLTRVVDPNLTQRMTEYVVQQVLACHRRQREYDRQQRETVWAECYTPTAGERRVGIMGLGVLGEDAASKLVQIGFPVAGWRRSRHAVPGVECFAGEAELDAFLARTDILVCLLPLTPETGDMLDGRLFAKLPEGAYVINAARGGHLVEGDLIRALDSGHLAGAVLDVFRTEPLPADHDFWRHPKIVVTPHVASISDPRTIADQVAENIRRDQAGEPLLNRVDLARGY
ncbi:2-hydroxyacid dehydrogenase [Oceanibacterium hippocampi]|uniref:Glyoxylate/hydroxypyruvate reductase A n=1 Tax=Oceanibacterium hippocampi TaxID=745714 RepID=A0A1Y5RTF4_9PROT|nr:glyoxylate/hydroxypyruvate reductase A [Oceanibacterium hippocampi]SLN25165.1 Glyoxylate/hydroxypyruvate reductase A [Oceanibacterium hippocampi]